MKLTDTQLIILAAAAQREDRLLTLASDMDPAAAEKLAARLIKTGLIEEVEAAPDMPVWRRTDDGAWALRITDQGLVAIHADEAAPASSPEEVQPAAAEQAAPRRGRSGNRRTSAASPRTGAGERGRKRAGRADASGPRGETKLDKVSAMLQRKRGATIAELMEATGWLSHTTRAVLTGLRKRGHVIEREAAKGKPTIYRITGSADGHAVQTSKAA